MKTSQSRTGQSRRNQGYRASPSRPRCGNLASLDSQEQPLPEGRIYLPKSRSLPSQNTTYRHVPTFPKRPLHHIIQRNNKQSSRLPPFFAAMPLPRHLLDPSSCRPSSRRLSRSRSQPTPPTQATLSRPWQDGPAARSFRAASCRLPHSFSHPPPSLPPSPAQRLRPPHPQLQTVPTGHATSPCQGTIPRHPATSPSLVTMPRKLTVKHSSPSCVATCRMPIEHTTCN